jgi:hypothetical protein
LGREELRAKLGELQEAREIVEKELKTIEGRKEHVELLEHARDTLMEYNAGMVPESLNDLSPEERHQIYKMLRIEGRVHHSIRRPKVRRALGRRRGATRAARAPGLECAD